MNPIDDIEETGWTIYCRPLDFPLHYAVRRWWITDEGLLMHSIAVLCDTLDEAREQIPSGTICFPRDPEDDAMVVETWL